MITKLKNYLDKYDLGHEVLLRVYFTGAVVASIAGALLVLLVEHLA